MPKPKRASSTRALTRTKPDRLQDRERAKLLIFQGHSTRDAAAMLGINENTLRGWSAEGRWQEEIKQLKELALRVVERSPVSRQQIPTAPVQHVAFDLARTNRQTRSLLAKTANRTAKHVAKVAKEAPDAIFSNASDFASLTKASAMIDGSWDEENGSKLAIAINIGQMASDPKRIRPLTEQECQDLRAQGYDV